MHGEPILPVFAGLSDTKIALAHAGLSAGRLAENAELRLQSLDYKDAESAFHRMCRIFDIQSATALRNMWADRLARVSSQFPQHLHVALQAAAQEIADCGGELRLASLTNVVDAARAGRNAYYQSRMDELEEEEVVVAQVAEAAGRQRMRRRDITDETMRRLSEDRHARKLPPPTRSELDGLARRMIHRGVLAPDNNGRYRTPIPSFQTWLREMHLEKGVLSG